jgi:diguanylate cyclase (GGDEF)-like protein
MIDKVRKDFLTGFFLRDSLIPFLDKLLVAAKTKKKDFAVALIDIDRFKKFNDKFGHHFGDLILEYVASTLRLSLRGYEDYIFRYGGYEFVVIFPNKKPEEAFGLIRQINYNLANRPFLFENKLHRITISCGISGFPYDGHEVQDLLHKADKAMYFSKHSGHNLTTQAGKMLYIKLKNLIIVITSTCIIGLSGYILYNYFFRDYFSYVKEKVLVPAKIMKKEDPRKAAVIILKDGSVFEGYILAETSDKVILGLYLEEGVGSLVFKKSEIAEIKYEEGRR